MLLRTLAFRAGLAVALTPTLLAQPAPPGLELNTALMRSTFKIEGKTATGQISYGTAFVLGRPLKNDSGHGAYVLITAKHVLESLAGETAILNLRTQGPDGDWHRTAISLRIRSGAEPLWKAHPESDVVAMYVQIPLSSAIPLLPTTLLADDQMLTRWEIHPGDEVSCLGFPLGAQSSDAGFPVLRSGRVASYPLLPTRKTKAFMMDFTVFPGNSGGPVYLVNNTRAFGAAALSLGVVQAILGIVIQEIYVPETIMERSGTTERRIFLNLAQVVHASLIREVIEMLPDPPQ